MSFIIFDTVVLPFVPVTPIIISGFSNIPKKLGHIFIAKSPGNDVAFLFNNFSTLVESFASQRAT